MRRLSHDSPWWTAILTTVSIGACLAIYYTVPLPRDDPPPFLRLALFAVSLVLLCCVLAVQVRRQVRAGDSASVRVQSIVGLLLPVVTFFAIVYYLMADQFVGIASRTDALYFSVVTLGTVGYGDVHPVGGGAKAATMIQIVLDLVVVGVLVAIATARVRARVTRDEQRTENTSD